MKVKARDGDTLWRLSRIFGIPLPLLKDSNPLLGDELKKGEEVRIPGFRKVLHSAREGETVESIAGKLSLHPESLFLMNEDHISNTEFFIYERVTKRVIEGKKDYDYNALLSDLRVLQEIYPFIHIISAGNSVQGLEIPEVVIGSGGKCNHINGSFHANEWITTAVIMTFLNDYLLSLTNGTALAGVHVLPFYNETMLSIVPMVNPDGVNLVLNGPPDDKAMRTDVVRMNNGSLDFSDWKANIRGVDLNNQYPAHWEIEKERKIPKEPAPRDYPGDQPLTEPEAMAMAELALKRNFSLVMAFHTQGKEFYWGYNHQEPAISQAMANELAEVSGYLPVQFIDSHAGFKDWFINEWRRPGFTIELGEGVNPLPIEQFDEIYRDSLGILVSCLYL